MQKELLLQKSDFEIHKCPDRVHAKVFSKIRQKSISRFVFIKNFSVLVLLPLVVIFGSLYYKNSKDSLAYSTEARKDVALQRLNKKEMDVPKDAINRVSTDVTTITNDINELEALIADDSIWNIDEA